MSIEIHGTVAPGFEPVRDAFRENFELRGEIGASVAAYVDGRKVVELWAGKADTGTGRTWNQDTAGVIFSSTKGLVATAFLMLEDRGLIDLDKKVAHYWPEFGRDGKADITVRTLLNHRAGLCAVDEKVTLEDFLDPQKIEAVIVKQVPLWKPGTDQGYGATAFGMYAQPLFQRVAGETLGTFLRREVFTPLNADVNLGLPLDQNARIATLYPVTREGVLFKMLPLVARGVGVEGELYRSVLFGKGSAPRRAFTNPLHGKPGMLRLNEPAIRAMELPWMNALATADGLARVYGALGRGGELDGHRLVSEAAIGRVTPKQSWSNHDRVLCKPLGFSQGYTKDEAHLISPHDAAFGHTGAGGSVGFADPIHKLGMGYVMNRMDHHVRSPRCIALCHAMYQSLNGWT